MSQTIQTGLTSVTGNVTTVLSAGTPTPVLCATATRTANGTTNLATVTAGKTAYIIAFTLAINEGSGGATGTQTVSLLNDGTAIASLYQAWATNALSAPSGMIQNICFPTGYGIPVAATKIIAFSNSNTSGLNSASASVYYIEV